ncbi:MAG: hypothetical protein J7647_17550 [Cyanobacteria bacterium SBLK]|nr:hypothetical protein [Cyanobacteria bacterium SBLK]
MAKAAQKMAEGLDRKRRDRDTFTPNIPRSDRGNKTVRYISLTYSPEFLSLFPTLGQFYPKVRKDLYFLGFISQSGRSSNAIALQKFKNFQVNLINVLR